MNYNNFYAVFERKVKDYDFYTCRRALKDCHDTLNLWGADIDENYAVKIWAEIDALRDRQLKIKAFAQ